MRREESEFESSYIEGRNSIKEAINAGREINKVWILEPAEGRKLEPDLARILKDCKEKKIVTVRVKRSVLDKSLLLLGSGF